MKKLTAAVITAVLFATPALAEHHGHRGEHMMKKIDTNADGNISKAEHQKFSDEKFAKMDTNKDGQIDQAERDAMKAKWQAKKAEWKAKKDAEKPATK